MSSPTISAARSSRAMPTIKPRTHRLKTQADRLAPWLAFVVLLLVWEAACRLLKLPSFVLPSPSAILAATKGKKPSVVQLRTDDLSPEAVGEQIILALRQMRDELEAGALLTIDAKRARLRVLPL